MYKERISVFKVLSNVISIGAGNIAKFVLAMLIPSLVFFIICLFSGLITGSVTILSGFSIGEVLLCIIVYLVMIFAICIPLSVGTYYIARNYQDTHKIVFSDILVCFKKNMVLKSIGLSLLMTIILIVGYILLVIPGVILTYMFIFAFIVMIDNPKLGILEVISLSAKLSKGYKLKIFGYNILLGIIPALVYVLLRWSIVGILIYFIICLVISAFNLLGLGFFYMDSLDWLQNQVK